MGKLEQVRLELVTSLADVEEQLQKLPKPANDDALIEPHLSELLRVHNELPPLFQQMKVEGLEATRLRPTSPR